MSRKSVSVRISADGGVEVKNAFRDIGRTGQEALGAVATGSKPASAGLNQVEGASGNALRALEGLAAKASRAAASMRATAPAISDMQDRINRMTGVSPAVTQSTSAILAQGRALDELRAKYNPVFGVVRRYKDTINDIRAAHAQGAISADEMAAAIQRERQASLASIGALKGRTTAIQGMAGASGMAAGRMQGLFYQVNDIGVSLAGGMNPFTVMAQQGTQIAQIYGFGNGGVGAIFRDLGGMIRGLVTRIPLITAAAAAAGVAFLGLRHEINETTDASVSLGDTVSAAVSVIGSRISDKLRPLIEKIAPWFQKAWDAVTAGVRVVGNFIINGVTVAVEGVKTAVKAIPDIFSAAFWGAAEKVLVVLRKLGGSIELFIDSIKNKLNGVFGTNFQPTVIEGIDRIEQMRVEAKGKRDAAAGSGDEAYSDFRSKAAQIMGRDPMGDFFADVRDRATKAALEGAEDSADGAGGALRKAGEEGKKAAEKVATGWDAVTGKLADYARGAKDWGGGVGEAIVGGFKKAEDAIAEFVTTGKLKVKDLVQSILADLAKVWVRRSITGPLSNALMGALGGLGGTGGVNPAMNASAALAGPIYDGGGYTGDGPRSGGLDGKGGFRAILHPRETVVDHTKGQGGPGSAPRQTGGEFFMSDNGTIMARMRVQWQQDMDRRMAQNNKSLQRSMRHGQKSSWGM
ncbi:phage tail tape measure C-terminal domain-containing protein [Tranquillimonas rosea]|uniref:phage tail tape measure C-terminal domain-containing protein n=1 Tax=Tranquillimonas rosea TaxID=641238 RepID=UPI003BAC0F54